jgi:uncharacterized protein with von Willebrand factor type A (vWA) domain
VLRAAGMPVGTDRVQTSLQALQVAGLEHRGDFRAVLAACLVDRLEHRMLFDQAFDLFWRDPDLMGRMRALLLPKIRQNVNPGVPENRRLGDALFPTPAQAPQAAPPEQIELDAALTWSDRELLRKADFETMSADEWRAAKRMLADLKLLFEPLRTRRSRVAVRGGRPDWRSTMQAMARHGGELWDLRRREPRVEPAPLVILADISGSMSRYSRMLLHFAHTLAHADTRVESFVFGTRLTRTTRLLHSRDPDLAVSQVVRVVDDWSGGTRISACLHEFNHRWARRVLPGRATVLLITDGLEHGDTAALAFETERLAHSCRRLIWLNPLLRYDRFEPRAAGIQAMLPHVDRFLPAHNIDSLAQLAQVLVRGDARRR